MLFFRKFRPIDSQQSSHLFHFSTEEMSRPVGCGWFCLACCWVVFVDCFPSFKCGHHAHTASVSWKKKTWVSSPAEAFFSLARRHVQMESVAETVVAIEHASFQGSYALEAAEMPGCVFFPVRLFSECCALEKVWNYHRKTLPARQWSGNSALCVLKLRQVELETPPAGVCNDRHSHSIVPSGGLSHGSFYSAGIRCVTLGQETIGPLKTANNSSRWTSPALNLIICTCIPFHTVKVYKR